MHSGEECLDKAVPVEGVKRKKTHADRGHCTEQTWGGEALATQESSGNDAMVVNVRQTKKNDPAGVLIDFQERLPRRPKKR